MSKLHVLHWMSSQSLGFHCPACKCGHFVRVNEARTNVDGFWGWNGSMGKPTFTPSLLVFANDPELRCHSFVNDGMIQFLPDCFHDLKGKTVPIPEWEDG